MKRYLPDQPEPQPDKRDESRSNIWAVPHGGVWSRDDKRVPPVLVCREHDLAPDEH